MLIAIVGTIGSGKDTIADYLTNFHEYRRESFASSLKDAISVIFGWDRQLLDGRTKESRIWREQIDQWWSNRLQIPHLTPRWILQQWGTEVCRDSFHQEIWIASLENKLRNSKDDVVISDCRFPNEFKALKQAGGKIIRVKRGPEPEWHQYVLKALDGDINSKNILINEYNIHESEWGWYGLTFDIVIENNGSIDELYNKVNQFIGQAVDHPVSSILLPDVVSVDSWRTQF